MDTKATTNLTVVNITASLYLWLLSHKQFLCEFIVLLWSCGLSCLGLCRAVQHFRNASTCQWHAPFVRIALRCRRSMQIWVRVAGMPDPITAILGRKSGYTLDKSQVYHRATTERQPSTVTPTDNRELPINLMSMALYFWRKPESLQRTDKGSGGTYKFNTEGHGLQSNSQIQRI